MNKPSRRIRSIFLLLAVLLLQSAASCSARRKGNTAPPMDQAPSASHALQDIRIREIMGRLALPIDRLPQETDPAGQRQELLADMAAVAEELEENAARIPEVLQNVQMNETHRSEFLGYARRLGEQAAELRRQAADGDVGAARATFQAIDQTCQTCHQRFRVLPTVGTR